MTNQQKLHVGIMFITERPNGVETPKLRIMGNYELLLLDGREIDPRKYPKLSKLLKKNGLGRNLPNEYQEEDIQDSYVVARRMNREEIKFIENVRKQKDGSKK